QRYLSREAGVRAAIPKSSPDRNTLKCPREKQLAITLDSGLPGRSGAQPRRNPCVHAAISVQVKWPGRCLPVASDAYVEFGFHDKGAVFQGRIAAGILRTIVRPRVMRVQERGQALEQAPIRIQEHKIAEGITFVSRK